LNAGHLSSFVRVLCAEVQERIDLRLDEEHHDWTIRGWVDAADDVSADGTSYKFVLIQRAIALFDKEDNWYSSLSNYW
jgi:hypothetical protein